MYYLRLRRYRNTMMISENTETRNEKPRVEDAGQIEKKAEEKFLRYFGLTMTGKCE